MDRSGAHRFPEKDRRHPPVSASLDRKAALPMNILLIIIAIVAVILLLTGGFVQSLNFLLWVGLVLAIIAVIVFLTRVITGRRGV
jgi:hypothetical protein